MKPSRLHPGGVTMLIAAWWLAAAATLPAVQDETYYVVWGHHLGFGFLDHPPLVALIAQTARLVPASALVARLGVILVGIATLLAMRPLCRSVGLMDSRTQAAALLLGWGNLLGLIMGFIPTPDAGLLLCWTLALRESALALKGARARWLSAGAAVGLGLLSKYTMVLFFPVVFIALLAELRGRAARQGRPSIATPWPWAGAILALLMFSPNLVWNANNDWISVRFQTRHGFGGDRPAVVRRMLPGPLPGVAGGAEDVIGRPFRQVAPAESGMRLAVPSFVVFGASQVLLWGFIAVLFAAHAWRCWQERHVPWPPVDPDTAPLIYAAACTPLVFFGLVSTVSTVEANWPMTYLVGAALLLAPQLAGRLEQLAWAVLGNAIVLTVGIVQGGTGLMAVRPDLDRALQETHGFEPLAQALSRLKGPVFADSYQIASESAFHSPGLVVRQWPGLHRDSELVRNPAINNVSIGELQRAGAFWLVLSGLPVPRLPGFLPDSLAQLRDCRRGFQEITSESAAASGRGGDPCEEPIHVWYLARYVPVKPVKTPETLQQ